MKEIEKQRIEEYHGFDYFSLLPSDIWVDEYIPEYIKLNASSEDEVDLYRKWFVANQIIQQHPRRFVKFSPDRPVKFGKKIKKEVIIDCTLNNCYKRATFYFAPDDVLDVVKNNNNFLKPLISELKDIEKKFNQDNRILGITPVVTDNTERVIDMAGRFFSAEEIAKTLRAETELNVPTIDVKRLISKNASLIKRKQDEYLASGRNLRVATEAGRLEIINNLISAWEEKREDNNGKINKEISSEITKLLEQARKEVKGNEMTLTVDGKIDINVSLNANSNIWKLAPQIGISNLIIGLTASKQGINPAVLMGQLTSSWYKDYNSFGKNIIDSDEVKLPSALINSYDWDALEKKSEQFLDSMKSNDEYTDYEDVTESKAIENKRLELKSKL